MERIIGLGGVFIKSQDPKSLAEWYQKHLRINFNGNTYFNFENNAATGGSAVISFFKQDSQYFNPSGSSFMINLRVKDLKVLFEKLKAEGVTTVGEMMDEDYGKFAWIMDPEGNKIELWQPV